MISDKKFVKRVLKRLDERGSAARIETIKKKSQPKSSRVTSTFQKGIGAIRNPTKALYGKNYIEPKKSKNLTNKQYMALLRAIKEQKNKPFQRQPQPVSFYDWCFNAGDNEAPLVEKEIMSFGGHATAGDFATFNMENEVMKHANASTGGFFNPVADISREVFFLSNFQHTRPTKKLKSEVDFLSNLLP